MLKAGVVKTSLKSNEKRVPIYPEHVSWIPIELRRNMCFEAGYGQDFGLADSYFLDLGCGIASRDELFRNSDLLILPKPLVEDLTMMKEGQVLWGWPHAVQQTAIAQAAIDNKLTLIAFEAMHGWSASGEKQMHLLYKNNELAGYAAIHHALQLNGIDGFYGPRRLVVILGYGSVARGAIHALHSRGFNNIVVLTRRPVHLVSDQHPDVYFSQFVPKNDSVEVVNLNGDRTSLTDLLAQADMICNCVLQDTNAPIMYLQDHETEKLKQNSLIVDISCDKGMGFPFAKPTDFENPTFKVGKNITYYSVDHTPTYLWNAASREISKAILPYLGDVMAGRSVWEQHESIQKSIEIDNGIVLNRNIINFQKRNSAYPYEVA